MTEAEWLNCDHSGPRQLFVVHRFASVRKLQLIAAAYIRGAQARPEYAEARPCDDVIEAVADQLRPWDELALELAARPGHWGFTHILAVPQEPAAVAKGFRDLAATYRSDAAQSVGDLIRLVHDVVGNPFRPVAFASAWRTSTVVALAKVMYESRDFTAMPILADALQDAGCTNDDILDHCRGNGPHVRGCWVVDLVLGKE
jgi:hypothetical protein